MLFVPALLGILNVILTNAPNVWSSDESGLVRRASKPLADAPRRDTDPHTLPGIRGGCSTWAGDTCFRESTRYDGHVLLAVSCDPSWEMYNVNPFSPKGILKPVERGSVGQP